MVNNFPNNVNSITKGQEFLSKLQLVGCLEQAARVIWPRSRKNVILEESFLLAAMILNGKKDSCGMTFLWVQLEQPLRIPSHDLRKILRRQLILQVRHHRLIFLIMRFAIIRRVRAE